MTNDWARPVVHWEIGAADPERLRAFYSEMFNWAIGEGPIMSIPVGVGGPQPGPAGHIRASQQGGVTLYIQVRDLADSLARTVALGGTVVRERIQIPDGATLALITDPEGNRVVLVQQ
jgi:predicted enzyme related to lactoylglutathione lyase